MSRNVGPIAGIVLLLVRGILLWIAVPLGTIAWLVTLARIRRPLGQFLGWVDANLIALLERTILRPLFPSPTQEWVAARDMRGVSHRIGALDFF
jgi:hypothetical protein